MKRRQSTEYNFWHLLLGLLMGFFLGSGLVFLNFNRKDDKTTSGYTLNTPKVHTEKKLRSNITKHNNNIASITGYNNVSSVITDQLIEVKTLAFDIKPIEVSAARKTLDTLIGKASAVSQRPNNLYRIEFWESPFNYRGYKKSRNRIVLYGISATNAASFEVHNNEIYLQYLNYFYHLSSTNELMPLVPITNESLIDQIRFKW